MSIQYLRYSLRGRTKDEWAALNEVLLERELGIETDTGAAKVGNGLDGWNARPYVFGQPNVLVPAQITADTHNYAPYNHATTDTFRLTTDASRTLTGLAGGVDGRRVLLVNGGSFTLTLAHQSTSSAAANRFACPGSATLTLGAGDAALLSYDGTASRWRVVASSVGGSGGSSTWDVVSADTAMVAGHSYVVDASGGTRTMTLPATVAAGQSFAVNAKGGSVIVASNGNTIAGVGAGNDLGLSDGDTVVLVSTAAGALQIVSSGFATSGGGSGSGTANRVLKTADESRANNTTLADDGQLKIALVPAGLYLIRARVFYLVGNNAADFKYQWNFTGTVLSARSHRRVLVAGDASTTGEFGGAEDATGVIMSAPSQPDSSASGIGFFELTLLLDTSTSGGVFSLQWAQRVSNAAGSTVCRGSYFDYERLA